MIKLAGVALALFKHDNREGSDAPRLVLVGSSFDDISDFLTKTINPGADWLELLGQEDFAVLTGFVSYSIQRVPFSMALGGGK